MVLHSDPVQIRAGDRDPRRTHASPGPGDDRSRSLSVFGLFDASKDPLTGPSQQLLGSIGRIPDDAVLEDDIDLRRIHRLELGSGPHPTCHDTRLLATTDSVAAHCYLQLATRGRHTTSRAAVGRRLRPMGQASISTAVANDLHPFQTRSAGWTWCPAQNEVPLYRDNTVGQSGSAQTRSSPYDFT